MIPNKVFQALACARPVITADTHAARELLTDGRDALLVPADDPPALATAIRRIVDDRALADRLGAAGRAHVRGASVGERVLGVRWRSLLEGALQRVRARPGRHRGRGRRDVRGGSRGARGAPASRLLERAVRPRQQRPGGVVDRARRRPLGDGADRRADLPAGRPLRTGPGRLSRRSGGSGPTRPSCSSARRLPWRPAPSRSTSSAASIWLRLGGSGVRARVPPPPGDAMARARRLPPRRPRHTAAPVGLLVPRRGSPAPVRRGRARRMPDQGGDRARRRGDGALVRAPPGPPAGRRSDRLDRPPHHGHRVRDRDPALLDLGQLAVRGPLRRGRWFPERDPRDGGHPPGHDPLRGDPEPRRRLRRRSPAAAPRAPAPRSARRADRRSRSSP